MDSHHSLPIDMTELESAINAYYRKYYKEQLGLPNWKQKVASRLNEEDTFPERILKWIEDWLHYDFMDKRVLVVGGGTGAETFNLLRRKARVTALEPDPAAVSILAQKARLKYQIPNPAIRGKGEAIPFASGFFDFVLCYTVLEHTRQPVHCIDEMLRVVRPKGWIFIETPDSRHFYEGHYKMTLPLFAPKFLLRAWLRLCGRPTAFIDTLQFLTSRSLRNIFQNRAVTAFQVIHSWPESWRTNPSFQKRLVLWITRYLGIQRDQYWLIQKLETPR